MVYNCFDKKSAGGTFKCKIILNQQLASRSIT